MLRELRHEGIRINRMFWRWGCRYNLPDWLLLPLAIRALRRAEVLLFGKFVPERVLRILRSLAKEPTKFILITPYKPLVLPETDTSHEAHGLYHGYDAIWVQSGSFAADLRVIGYKKRVEVIPYMPEPTQPTESFPLGPIRVGFLGRLVEDKNVPLLIEAFDLFRNSLAGSSHGPAQPAALEVYGDGRLRSELQAQVDELGLRADVRFHGAIQQQQVARAISTCHLFVFTSRIEGQCLAALEILRCGRPIVATHAGVFPDMLQDFRFGRLAISNGAEDIAHAMEQVAASIISGEITPRTVQSAYMELFDADRIGDRYAQLFEQIGLSLDQA